MLEESKLLHLLQQQAMFTQVSCSHRSLLSKAPSKLARRGQALEARHLARAFTVSFLLACLLDALLDNGMRLQNLLLRCLLNMCCIIATANFAEALLLVTDVGCFFSSINR